MFSCNIYVLSVKILLLFLNLKVIDISKCILTNAFLYSLVQCRSCKLKKKKRMICTMFVLKYCADSKKSLFVVNSVDNTNQIFILLGMM